MIGLGLDLCDIPRMATQLAKGDGFLGRYFTDGEQAYIRAKGKAGAQSMAAMFAAKEAVLKAMGIGLCGGVALREVEVTHGERGRPGCKLHGAAAETLAALGGSQVWLSLTHEGDMAAAVAVLE